MRQTRPSRPHHARPAPGRESSNQAPRAHQVGSASTRDSGARGPHTREFLRVAGLPAVQALFARGADRIERLFFTAELQTAAAPLTAALARSRKPFRVLPGDELAKVAGSAMHGGIVAIAQPKPVARFDIAEAARWAARENLIVILDGVSNPHNLGAIARTAAFFGVAHMIVSDHPAQAMPSDAAYRVAEGGLDYLDLVQVSGIVPALRRLSQSFRIVGTGVAQGARSLATVPRDKPIALVLGNEERGLDRTTLVLCDIVATIPGSGRVQSLNVAAASAIAIQLFTSAR